MNYKVKENLTEDERMAELEAYMLRGNHQAARRKPEKLKKKLDRDVEYGFAVPINKGTQSPDAPRKSSSSKE